MELTQDMVKVLQAARVHFCIPCYGGQINEGTFISMLKYMATAQRLGLNFTIDTMVNESLVCRARNSLVAKMLFFEPKSTHLMFVDADIGFEPEEIFKLIIADRDVVGGLYPKKALPISYVVNKVPGAAKEGNLVEVANLGTGFMMIKRHVLEKMIANHPELHYVDSIGLDPKYDPFKYALFDTEIDNDSKEYLSEDYTFCKRWRAMGGKIWADLTISLNHIGYFTFRGDATQLQPHL
jgi:hypothetical protein